MAFLNIIIPILVSVFLILYFRRTDRRNTQLQTLKNFINTSMNNMLKLFQDKEKDLLDKTINLDISLKKLEKASTFINNKLTEIRDSITDINTVQQNLGAGLKEASVFNKEIDTLKIRISELTRATGEIDTLKKEITESRKAAAQIKADAEQSRVSAQETIADMVRKSQAEISQHKANSIEAFDKYQAEVEKKAETVESLLSQMDGSIEDAKERLDAVNDMVRVQFDDKEREIETLLEKNVNEIKSNYQHILTTMKAGLEEKLAAHKGDLEVSEKTLVDTIAGAKNEYLSSAQSLKQALGGTLNEFNTKWNENIKRFNEINKEILSKSAELDNQIKTNEKVLSKKAGDLEAAIIDRMGGFEMQINQILKQKGDKFDADLAKIESGVKVKAETIGGRIEANLGQTEKELRDGLYKKMGEIDGQVGTILKDFESRKNELGAKINGLTTSLESQFKKLENDYHGKIIDIEQKFGKINSDMASLEKKIQSDADQLFTKANNELSKEIDNLKKTVEANAEERLSRVDNKISEELKRFEEDFSSNIKNYNARLSTNAGALNEMASKLDKFVKETTERFKGEISGLKSSTTLEANRFIEEITGKEKSIASMMEMLQNDLSKAGTAIQNLGKEASELAVQKIRERESEINSNIEKSYGVISDRMSQIEKSIDNYEAEVNKKIQGVNTSIQAEIDSYKQSVEGLKSSGLKIEASVQDIISNRTKEVDTYMQKLKEGFVDDYKQLISNTKSDLVRLKDEIESIRTSVSTQKEGVLKDVINAIKEARDWSMIQVTTIKDEVEGAKLRTAGMMADARDEVEKEIETFQIQYQQKLAQVIKESEVDIGGKKTELKTLTQELLRQFNEKEKDLFKKIDRMDKSVTELLESTEKETVGLKKVYEQRLEDFYRMLEQKGDSSIDSLKKELAFLMEEYSKQLEAGKDEIIQLKGDVGQVRKETMSQKDSLIQDLNASLKEAREKNITELQSVKAEVDAARQKATELIAEVGETVNIKIQDFNKEIGFKINTVIQSAEAEMLGKKDEIKKMTDSMLKTVGSREDELLAKIKKMNDFIDNAVTKSDKEFIGFTKSLEQKFIDTNKGLEIRAEAESEKIKEEVKKLAEKHKEEALVSIDELKGKIAELNQALSRNSSSVKTIENEITSTKQKAAGLLQDVQAAVGDKIQDINQEINSKLNSILESTEEELSSRKKDIEAMTAAMLRGVQAKEDELAEQVNRMNQTIEGAIKTSDNEIAVIHQALEKRFSELTQDIQNKSEGDLEKIRGELRVLAEKTKTEALVSIDDMKVRLQELNQALNVNSSTVKNIEKDIVSTRQMASGLLVDVQASVDEKIQEIHQEINIKLNSILESTEEELVKRKKELEAMTAGMIQTVQAKEDELAGQVNRMNQTVEGAIKASDKEIAIIHQALEKRFSELTQDIQHKSESELESIKGELRVLAEKTKAEALVSMDDIKSRIQELNQALLVNTSSVKTIENDIVSTRQKAAGLLEDVQASVGDKIQDINQEINSKLNSILENTEEELVARRKEIEAMTAGMLRGVQAKENELADQVSRMNQAIEGAIQSSDKEIAVIHQTLEKRFGEISVDIQKKAEGGLEKIRGELRVLAEKTKAEALVSLDDVKTRILDLNDSINSGKKDFDILQNNVGSFNQNLDTAKDEASKKLVQLETRYQQIQGLIGTLESKINQAEVSVESELKDYMKDLYAKVELQKQELSGAVQNVKDSYLAFVENAKKDTAEQLKEHAKVNLDKLNHTLEDYKKTFLKDIQAFQDSFMPPADEILGKVSQKAELIQADLNKKMEALEKNIDGFQQKINANQAGLSDAYKDIIAQFNAKVEENKTGMSSKINEYLNHSNQEFKKIADKVTGMDKELKFFEEKTIESIRNKAVAIEGDLTKKLGGISNNFENYLKKNEQDLGKAVESTKKEINSLFDELKNQKEETREIVLNDIKELNKRTRDIELRYEAMLKKTSILERAEAAADKSSKNVETLAAFMRDLDIRRKELEESLKMLETIKTEHRDLNSILVTINNSKKDANIVQQTIIDALQKAKDTQDILSSIERQQAKADEVRKTLVETLKVYEEIKIRIADAEKKRDIINKIIESVDTSKDNISSIDSKVASIDEKINAVSKASKKLEDDVKSAQINITKLFSDQDRVSFAVDKIADIENLLIHIEEESKKVQKMRDWVAKLETQLERIKDTQESALGSKKIAEVDRGSDEDIIKNVLRLKEQGWSIDEISKSLKISKAYVELIIERYEE